MDALPQSPPPAAASGNPIKRNSVLWAKFNALSLVTAAPDTRPAPVFEDPAVFRSKAAHSSLPNHPAVPEKNVFISKAPKTASRLVSILETYLMTPTSIQRAQQFRPKRNDCIVVAPPECGEPFITRIVRFLQSDKPLDVSKDRKTTAPWIESRYCDDDAEVLEHLQTRRGRVFKTAMSWEMCKPHSHPGVKYVVCVRHPVDLRAQWIQYLKRCYEVEDESDPLPDFDATFNVDDFVNLPVSLCHVQTPPAPKLYETFVHEWSAERKSNKDQVCIVCFEALVHDPAREIRKIATFLQLPVYDDLINIILKDLARDGLSAPKKGAALKRRMTRILNGGAEPAQRRKTEGSGAFTSGRLFGMGTGSQLLSPDSCKTITSAWRRIVTQELDAATYAEYYDIFGHREEYPFPQEDDPAPSSRMLTKSFRAAKSMSLRVLKSPTELARTPERIRSYRKAKEEKVLESKNEKKRWLEQQSIDPIAGVVEQRKVFSLDDVDDGPPVPPLPPYEVEVPVEDDLPPPSSLESAAGPIAVPPPSLGGSGVFELPPPPPQQQD